MGAVILGGWVPQNPSEGQAYCVCPQAVRACVLPVRTRVRARTFFFLTRDRSSTKCPLRVHIAGHASVTGPTLGMGLV